MDTHLIASERLERVCEIAKNNYGIEFEIDLFVEEIGELLQALMHFRRGRGTLEAIHSELADVLIMCWQMRSIFGKDRVDERLEYKISRLEERLTGDDV